MKVATALSAVNVGKEANVANALNVAVTAAREVNAANALTVVSARSANPAPRVNLVRPQRLPK